MKNNGIILKRKIYDKLLDWKGKSKIAPIEVKSGNYRMHSSLDKFVKKYDSKIGNRYILYTKDLMEKDGIWHLPIYMAMYL